MLIQRPQTPIWKQHIPVVPVPTPSPLSPKRWMEQDSGGAVGLGIVAALHKSIKVNSPVKFTGNTAPVEIISPRRAGCRGESCRHCHKTERWRDESSPPMSSDVNPIKRMQCRKENIVPAAEFLRHCSLCRKQLHGKDVYMYRDKAFCSMECRYQQIENDEMQEKCRLLGLIPVAPNPYRWQQHYHFLRDVMATK